MNLVEVLVAGSIVLGTAAGSLGIWANTAQATRGAEDLLAQRQLADAQLLAVQAGLQALAAARRDGSLLAPDEGCLALTDLPDPATERNGALSEGLSQDLSDGQGDAEAALTLTGDPAAQTLTATVQVGEEHSRSRVFDLAVYGLCAPAAGAS
jgi:hypothetical protein